MTELLRTFVGAPSTACQRARLLSAAQRHSLLVDFNRTEREFPDALVHELVTAQAARTPSALAVVDETEQLSYATLEAEAAKLSATFAIGARRATRIAISLTDRALVGALLAVRAGAAYGRGTPTCPRARPDPGGAQVELVPPNVRWRRSFHCLWHGAICVDRIAAQGSEAPPALRSTRRHPAYFCSPPLDGVQGSNPHTALFISCGHAARARHLALRSRAGRTTLFDLAGLELYLP